MKGIFAILFACTLISISSCRNSDRDLDSGTDTAKEYWVAVNNYANLIRMVHQVAVVDTVLMGIDSADAIPPEICLDTFTRVPDTGPFPIDLNIVFSDSTSCPGTKLATDTLKARFSGLHSQYGTKIIINPYHYKYDDYLITGFITWTVKYITTDTIAYDVTIQEGLIEDLRKSGNNKSYCSGTFTFYQSSGRKTVTSLDDDFLYVGDATGLAQNGVYYTATGSEWFSLPAGCFYETSGISTIVSENRQNRILDLGGGGCNNKMVVSIPPANGNYDVTIR